MDLDTGGPKTYGSYESGSAILVRTHGCPAHACAVLERMLCASANVLTEKSHTLFVSAIQDPDYKIAFVTLPPGQTFQYPDLKIKVNMYCVCT
jgi:hypothetical protein